MPGEDDKKKVEELSMRIKELEAQLSQLTTATAPQDVSADEIRAYHKVRKSLGSSLAGWDQECGINECQPLRCIPGTSSGSYRRWRIQRCINECTCGPCNIDAIRESLEMTKLELEHITTVLRGGGGRFGGLG